MKILVMTFFSLMLLTKSGYALEPKNAKAVTTHEQKVFDQSANKAPDLEFVKKIRNTLNEDQTLSKNGKNIQIIVVKKEVIIKGPVNSEAEKNKILSIVTSLKTDHSIRNQLEISNSVDLSTP